MVRLKVPVAQDKKPKVAISIPYGAIKSKKHTIS